MAQGKEISPLRDVRIKRAEKEAAKLKGMECCEAGMPDHEAIKREFGFSLKDLYPDKSIRPYRGKRNRGQRYQGLLDDSDRAGDHDQSGADFS